MTLACYFFFIIIIITIFDFGKPNHDLGHGGVGDNVVEKHTQKELIKWEKWEKKKWRERGGGREREGEGKREKGRE